MKIRIVKESGAVIELSDVAGVQVIDAGKLSISRLDPFSAEGAELSLHIGGPTNGLGVYDPSIKWPLPEVVIG